MQAILDFVTRYQPILTLFGAIAAFTWPIWQFTLVRRRDARNRDFEIYHRLVKELVVGDGNGVTFQDRQCAVAFELRHFPLYHPVTHRFLTGLLAGWRQNPITEPRLIKEIELTLEYIAARRSYRDA